MNYKKIILNKWLLWSFWQKVLAFFIAEKGLWFGCLYSVIYYPYWRFYQSRYTSPLTSALPWIPFKASRFLKKQLRKGQSACFEYGSGGSTVFFARHAKAVYSVEHNKHWFQKVQDYLRQNHHNIEIDLIEPEAPLHSEEESIYNASRMLGKEKSFYRYASVIERHSDDFFDIIFIDGRARVGCFKKALPKLKPGGFIILDDFHRKEYGVVFGFVTAEWRHFRIKGPAPWSGGHVIKDTAFWQRPIEDLDERT